MRPYTATTASPWSAKPVAITARPPITTYYRKAINVTRNHPDSYDPEFEAVFQKLIDRLEPKADAPAN